MSPAPGESTPAGVDRRATRTARCQWRLIGVLALTVAALLSAACEKYPLNVTIVPPESTGTVELAPGPDSEGRYKKGTEVRLLAAPFEGQECGDTSYWRFLAWQGDASGSFPTALVKMDGERNVKVAFAEYSPPPCETPLTVRIGLQDPAGSGRHAFDPAELKFSVGDTVTFELSAETELHTFTVDELEIDEAADDGETVSFTFTFDEAGEYGLICIPHESEGMVGKITVE